MAFIYKGKIFEYGKSGGANIAAKSHKQEIKNRKNDPGNKRVGNFLFGSNLSTRENGNSDGITPDNYMSSMNLYNKALGDMEIYKNILNKKEDYINSLPEDVRSIIESPEDVREKKFKEDSSLRDKYEEAMKKIRNVDNIASGYLVKNEETNEPESKENIYKKIDDLIDLAKKNNLQNINTVKPFTDSDISLYADTHMPSVGLDDRGEQSKAEKDDRGVVRSEVINDDDIRNTFKLDEFEYTENGKTVSKSLDSFIKELDEGNSSEPPAMVFKNETDDSVYFDIIVSEKESDEENSPYSELTRGAKKYKFKTLIHDARFKKISDDDKKSVASSYVRISGPVLCSDVLKSKYGIISVKKDIGSSAQDSKPDVKKVHNTANNGERVDRIRRGDETYLRYYDENGKLLYTDDPLGFLESDVCDKFGDKLIVKEPDGKYKMYSPYGYSYEYRQADTTVEMDDYCINNQLGVIIFSTNENGSQKIDIQNIYGESQLDEETSKIINRELFSVGYASVSFGHAKVFTTNNRVDYRNSNVVFPIYVTEEGSNDEFKIGDITKNASTGKFDFAFTSNTEYNSTVHNRNIVMKSAGKGKKQLKALYNEYVEDYKKARRDQYFGADEESRREGESSVNSITNKINKALNDQGANEDEKNALFTKLDYEFAKMYKDKENCPQDVKDFISAYRGKKKMIDSLIKNEIVVAPNIKGAEKHNAIAPYSDRAVATSVKDYQNRGDAFTATGFAPMQNEAGEWGFMDDTQQFGDYVEYGNGIEKPDNSSITSITPYLCGVNSDCFLQYCNDEDSYQKIYVIKVVPVDDKTNKLVCDEMIPGCSTGTSSKNNFRGRNNLYGEYEDMFDSVFTVRVKAGDRDKYKLCGIVKLKNGAKIDDKKKYPFTLSGSGVLATFLDGELFDQIDLGAKNKKTTFLVRGGETHTGTYKLTDEFTLGSEIIASEKKVADKKDSKKKEEKEKKGKKTPENKLNESKSSFYAWLHRNS